MLRTVMIRRFGLKLSFVFLAGIAAVNGVLEAQTLNLIYNFTGGSDGGVPLAGLVLDASGNLYGTTHCDGADSAGTVYKLTPASGSWTYTSLYVFTGGTDGLYVYSNPVLLEGHIYGTTKLGGANGNGVIWQVIP